MCHERMSRTHHIWGAHVHPHTHIYILTCETHITHFPHIWGARHTRSSTYTHVHLHLEMWDTHHSRSYRYTHVHLYLRDVSHTFRQIHAYTSANVRDMSRSWMQRSISLWCREIHIFTCKCKRCVTHFQTDIYMYISTYEWLSDEFIQIYTYSSAHLRCVWHTFRHIDVHLHMWETCHTLSYRDTQIHLHMWETWHTLSYRQIHIYTQYVAHSRIRALVVGGGGGCGGGQCLKMVSSDSVWRWCLKMVS